MALTQQQQQVLDTLANPDVSLVLTPACAGSGKTHTLLAIASAFDIEHGVYLAYNKAIADEADEKFKGTNIRCLTTHSLAYKAVVKQYGLKVGFFSARDVVTEGITYKDKMLIVSTVDDFLTSTFIDPIAYLEYIQCDDDLAAEVTHHLNLMSDGVISCSHNFYLKMYHVLLATGALPVPYTNILMLDEFGDVNPVTLEIFKLIEADKKIAVGDAKQNIYSFNGTINGFEALANAGTTVPLTQSFRVASPIAKRIEQFIRANVDKEFEFKGREYPDNSPITTKAFIARNNTGLVERMYQLMEVNKVFHTTRKIESILELPLILANLENGKPIKEYAYKHIEAARKTWSNSYSLQTRYPRILAYILEKFSDDEELERAVKVVAKHSTAGLNELVAYCNSCRAVDTDLTLTTAHSSKGLEFSSVEIADDLNAAIEEAKLEITELKRSPNKFSKHSIKQLEEEFLLGYVAASRAMVELKNATFLGREPIC